jgi:hypothetical protein
VSLGDILRLALVFLGILGATALFIALMACVANVRSLKIKGRSNANTWRLTGRCSCVRSYSPSCWGSFCDTGRRINQ